MESSFLVFHQETKVFQKDFTFEQETNKCFKVCVCAHKWHLSCSLILSLYRVELVGRMW